MARPSPRGTKPGGTGPSGGTGQGGGAGPSGGAGRSAIVAAVSAYSGRVLPELLAHGGATCPLAPWLLAALVAPAATLERRARLESVLGVPTNDAAALASELAGAGPRSLRAALALWRCPDLATDGALGRWELGLPGATGRGPIPSQAEADDWTRLNTSGLIRRFPAAVGPSTLAVLAAAIAARAHWDRPLERAWPGPNAWNLENMLSAEPVGVFDTGAGRLGVARSVATGDGVSVYSFIGAPDVARGTVASAAIAAIADWYAADDPDTRIRDAAVALAGLEPRGHAWTVEPSTSASAIVPAFVEKTDSADILALPGIDDAAATLGELVREALPRPEPIRIGAVMSAVARYDRVGFEAAAVAAMIVAMAAFIQPQPRLHLRFDRPHLAVAVATDERFSGLPLFAAWVDAGVCEPSADRRPR